MYGRNILLWSYRTETPYLLTRWVGPSGSGQYLPPLKPLEGRRDLGPAALRCFGVDDRQHPHPQRVLPGGVRVGRWSVSHGCGVQGHFRILNFVN